MSLFDKIRKAFADGSRQDRRMQWLYTDLMNVGVYTRMVDYGHTLEKIGGGTTLGILEIAEGSIRWVKLRDSHRSRGGSGLGSSGVGIYYADYGVPDLRLEPNFPSLRIKSVRKTTMFGGNVVDLRWKGKDLGLGIIDRLSSDKSLKDLIMKSRDVEIRAYGKIQCWTITTEWVGDPMEELWNCYQKIAQHLLAEWYEVAK